MRFALAILMLVAATRGLASQPADCPTEPASGQTMPLTLDLAGRHNVPPGTTGQAYIDVPLTAPGIACRDVPAHPLRDVLRGGPGDLLRGPGTPHVHVEVQ
jgi:hypothetical protein